MKILIFVLTAWISLILTAGLHTHMKTRSHHRGKVVLSSSYSHSQFKSFRQNNGHCRHGQSKFVQNIPQIQELSENRRDFKLYQKTKHLEVLLNQQTKTEGFGSDQKVSRVRVKRSRNLPPEEYNSPLNIATSEIINTDTNYKPASYDNTEKTYVKDDNGRGYFCYGMTNLMYESSKYFPTKAIPSFTGAQMSANIVIQNTTDCDRSSRLNITMATVLNVTVETCCISWCEHHIEVNVRDDQQILFNFIDFNVPGLNLASSENQAVCDESLEVIVDPNENLRTNKTLIGSFCGIKAPTSVFVEYSKAKLVLKLMDNAQCVNKIDFTVQIVPCLKFSYKECNSSDYVRFGRDSGYISSPGLAHGQNYPNDLHCVWNISVPEGKLIRLNASEIRLRHGDMIQISPKQVGTRPFPSLLRFSDHNFRQPVVLPSNECSLEFHSDSLTSGIGFNISYTAVDVSYFIPMFANHSLDCSDHVLIPTTMRCNFYVDCANGNDERNCSYKDRNCWPQGYAMNGRCYQLVINQTLSWTMAEEFCERNLNSHLVTLSTEAQRKSVDKLREFIGTGLSIIFLGLQRMRMQQVTQMYRRMWQWSDGTTAFYLPDEYRYEGWSTCSLFFGDYFHSTNCGAIKDQVSFICQKKMKDVKTKSLIDWTPGREVSTNAMSQIKISVFRCQSGEYISIERRCDKVENCFDRSDEVDCDYDSLTDTMFSCDSGGLLAYTFVCNGVHECLDSSDENWCSIPDKAALGSSMATCTDGMTMERSRLCDGKEDCRDASDEEDCTDCVGGSELCPMIACLPNNWTTDDEIDCPIRDLKGRRAPEPGFRENVFKTDPPPGIVVPDGYGKFEIQEMAKGKGCPHTHVQCLEGYCIPVYMWCNGVLDCPHGEDEILETCRTVCENMYKCKHSRVCVHSDHLCDGYYQCPNHDDEQLCSIQNMSCPSSCTCRRMEVTCSAQPKFTSPTPVRYLRLSQANLPELYFDNIISYTLIYLNVSSCNVLNIKRGNLKFLNLRILDISNNLIESLAGNSFQYCPSLKILMMAQNKLKNVNFSFLENTRELTKLDLSFNIQNTLEDDCFYKANNLEELILRYMLIDTISPFAFRGLLRLKRLDMKGNNIITFSIDIFKSTKNLRTIITENFRLCCPSMKHNSVQFTDCVAPYDEISSCADILRTLPLRVALWLMAVLTIIGNVGVIIYRIFYDRGIKYSFRIIITCLSASDLIMGIYLVIIGTADVMYRDRYLMSEREWKSSTPCQVAGFLCLLSSETSAMFILLVTVDRFLAIAFPLHPALHFNARSASVASAIVWGVGLFMATVPLLPPFQHWELYSQKAVGVPLPITRLHFPGYDYAFAIFIVFNMMVFLLVAMGQVLIYLSVHLQKHPQISEARVRQDTAIAKRLFLVVITDCLCWFPITVMGLAARAGQPVPGEMYLVTTVFLLPANSAFNPFLYTAYAICLARQNRRKKIAPVVSYGLRRISR